MNKRYIAKKAILSAVIFIILLALDLYTKSLAVRYLKGTDGIPLIKGVLELFYVENTGMAFSMLKGRQIFFLILTPVICILILVFMSKIISREKLALVFYILTALLSGAVGNYIDRLLNGYVVDFIYFSLINFPVFNVADIYVTVSVFLLFILILFNKNISSELDVIFPSKDRS